MTTTRTKIKKKPRIADITMLYVKGTWSWYFFSSHGSFGYKVESCAGYTESCFPIREATRVAKRNGFDDAKVTRISIQEGR